MKKNILLYPTLGALIGTATFTLINYLSKRQIDWTLTLILFVTMWIAVFIRNRIIMKRMK